MSDATTVLTATETTTAATGQTTETATTTAASTETTTAAATVTTPTVPETYDLKLPDGSTLDGSLVERTAATARALGLSTNEAAQQVLDHTAKEIAQYEQATADALNATREEWRKAAESDATLGKTPEERQATVDRGRSVLTKYGEANKGDADAMKTFLDTSGFGNHPAVLRFFAWLGKSAAEKSLVMPGAEANGGGGRSIAETLYPNHAVRT